MEPSFDRTATALSPCQRIIAPSPAAHMRFVEDFRCPNSLIRFLAWLRSRSSLMGEPVVRTARDNLLLSARSEDGCGT